MLIPARGDVAIGIAGDMHPMRLTLGALAELEASLGGGGLVALAERFETGAFTAEDILRLICAGLRGAGQQVTEAEVGAMPFDGGVTEAAKAAARLLQATFAPLAGEPGQ